MNTFRQSGHWPEPDAGVEPGPAAAHSSNLPVSRTNGFQGDWECVDYQDPETLEW